MNIWIIAAVLAIVLSGCTSVPVAQKITFENDPRVGTDQSPYRSIATVLQINH
jgi:hypothetical protein